MKESMVSYQRSLAVAYRYDVAVFGAGIAGICAACRAADSGASVILTEQYGAVGGNATVGGVAAFCGNTRGQGAVFDEIVSELEHYNAIAPYVENFQLPRIFDHEILAVVLQEMLLKRGIKLLLHTRLIDAVCEDRMIKYAVISGKSGNQAIAAKQFIDCTGDGDLAAFAGCASEKGRESDGMQLPMSLMYFVRDIDEKDAAAKTIPQDRFDAIREKDQLPMTTFWPNGPGGSTVKIKIPGFDATDTEGLTAAEIQGHRRMMEVLSYYQNVEHKPIMLDHYPTQIGIREGRRITGDYYLTVDELRSACSFDDGIAVGTFMLDGHKPDDDKRTYILSYKEMCIPPYQIPFRCLTARDADNLLIGGRCISCDQLSLTSARVMTTCAMTGQAAGLAAALCCRDNTMPRQLDGKRLKKMLIEYGADMDIAALRESQKKFGAV